MRAHRRPSLQLSASAGSALRCGEGSTQPLLSSRCDISNGADCDFSKWQEHGEAWVDSRLKCEFLGFLWGFRSEEHTSELQSLMRISYAVFCLKKKNSSTIFKVYI